MEVNRLLKQFDETRRIMKMVAKGGDLSKLTPKGNRQ
jgi:signal recognition particle GTPase